MTRLAMRPAKSFWKKVQLWRTTWKWFCQRIRLDRPGAITWLVTRYWPNSAAGRATSSTSAISASSPPAWRSSVRGVSADTRAATWPMNTGIVVSSSATTRPIANSAAIVPGAWPTKWA